MGEDRFVPRPAKMRSTIWETYDEDIKATLANGMAVQVMTRWEDIDTVRAALFTRCRRGKYGDDVRLYTKFEGPGRLLVWIERAAESQRQAT